MGLYAKLAQQMLKDPMQLYSISSDILSQYSGIRGLNQLLNKTQGLHPILYKTCHIGDVSPPEKVEQLNWCNLVSKWLLLEETYTASEVKTLLKRDDEYCSALQEQSLEQLTSKDVFGLLVESTSHMIKELDGEQNTTLYLRAAGTYKAVHELKKRNWDIRAHILSLNGTLSPSTFRAYSIPLLS